MGKSWEQSKKRMWYNNYTAKLNIKPRGKSCAVKGAAFFMRFFRRENVEELKIVYRRLDELKVYENNPRNNEDAVERVAESIRQFGFKVPILIDENDVIIAGHTRKLAAKELGMEEVPCICVRDLSEERVKAFRLADNKVAEFSSWDPDKLADELAEILNIDMTAFDFPDMALDELSVSDEDFLRDTEIVKDRTPKKIVCPHCGKEFTP